MTFPRSARINMSLNANSGVQRPPWALVVQFSQIFMPEQARLAPERMIMLAKGSMRLAEEQGNV